MQAILAEMRRLRKTAANEASRVVHEFTRGRREFFPSRVAKSRTSQRLLTDIHDAAWRLAISTRLAQLHRLDRKATRLCPSWERRSTDELSLPPHYDPTL